MAGTLCRPRPLEPNFLIALIKAICERLFRGRWEKLKKLAKSSRQASLACHPPKRETLSSFITKFLRMVLSCERHLLTDLFWALSCPRFWRPHAFFFEPNGDQDIVTMELWFQVWKALSPYSCSMFWIRTALSGQGVTSKTCLQNFDLGPRKCNLTCHGYASGDSKECSACETKAYDSLEMSGVGSLQTWFHSYLSCHELVQYELLWIMFLRNMLRFGVEVQENPEKEPTRASSPDHIRQVSILKRSIILSRRMKLIRIRSRHFKSAPTRQDGK